MTTEIQFPDMRTQVQSAVESLSDRSLQSRWGTLEPGANFYDDLTLNVNLLYDDSMVLPDPSSAVPELLYPDEVAALETLGATLGQLIERLGERSDRDYLCDPCWPQVVSAAARALAIMRAHE